MCVYVCVFMYVFVHTRFSWAAAGLFSGLLEGSCQGFGHTFISSIVPAEHIHVCWTSELSTGCGAQRAVFLIFPIISVKGAYPHTSKYIWKFHTEWLKTENDFKANYSHILKYTYLFYFLGEKGFARDSINCGIYCIWMIIYFCTKDVSPAAVVDEGEACHYDFYLFAY